jgi:hypothetical protein
MTRKCLDCEVTKPIEDFPKAGAGRYRHRCKPCYNTAQARWREDNPDKIRESWRKAHGKYYSTDKRRNKTLRAYGLNENTYNDLFDEQAGRCKICDGELPLVVDHDHKTNIIRGLLCNKCNVGLGCFDDDLERLASAIKYLAPI